MAITDAQRLMAKSVLSNTAGRLLRRGSKGVSVRAMQAFLADNGYDVGRLDGVFGKRTQAALKAFQKASGISADGRAGQTTFNKIRDAMGVIPVPRENPMFAAPEPVEGVAGADLVPGAADLDTPMPAEAVPPGMVVEETVIKPLAPAAEFAPTPEMDMSPDAFLDAKERDWGVSPLDVQHRPPIMPEAPMPGPAPEEMAAQQIRDTMPVPAYDTGAAGARMDAPPEWQATPGDGLDALRAALLGKVHQQNMPQSAMGAGMSPMNSLSMSDMLRALTMGR